MSTGVIFFDQNHLNRRNYFRLKSDIRTIEGDVYEIEEWIDRGGNASVFKCTHRTTGDEYAIKILMNTRARNAKRFLREVQLLQSLKGDHVTQYQGAGRVTVRHNKYHKDTVLPFVVMELADCNLQEKMNKEGPVSYEQYIGQFRGLAAALANVHQSAVHRDIKPENILVVGERWLLSDYGLCTFVSRYNKELTIEGENIGPRYWLSPEAHNRRLGCSDEISKASDVFQLAAIFWYVVTGRHPCGVVTADDWNGPEKLFGLLHKSLYHDYRKRPQNGQEFFSQLESAIKS